MLKQLSFLLLMLPTFALAQDNSTIHQPCEEMLNDEVANQENEIFAAEAEQDDKLNQLLQQQITAEDEEELTAEQLAQVEKELAKFFDFEEFDQQEIEKDANISRVAMNDTPKN